MKPLAGVRILDFTRILAGPYCTLLLADMGAEVVKIESSERGDDTRGWGPPFLDDEGTLSTYFAALNRSKKSVALDFRAPETRSVLLQLCKNADVVIENFRPGVAEKIGLSWPALREANPAIVFCSISGFGNDGPYAELPATEIVVEAMSGLMEITGPQEGDPARFGVAMTDIATGLTAATRIVAALMSSRATGDGAYIQCSLYATALAVLGTAVAAYSASAAEPRRWGSHHPSIVPYGGFPTADGQLITGVVNNATWPSFCEALGLDKLAQDQRYDTNAGRVAHRVELCAAIGRRCEERTTIEWVEVLSRRGLLAAPIRTVGQAVQDPATQAMGLLVGLDGYPGIYGTRLDGLPIPLETEPVPRLGEHTHEILAKLMGVTAAEIDLISGVRLPLASASGRQSRAQAPPRPNCKA